ncbi:MAG: phosphonate ABC transporter, permease protein PhnE [Chloroflexi bacterium]|nr:phosphonate ABC transporter, permease protein PhnE [Chloroflexota bacterium]
MATRAASRPIVPPARPRRVWQRLVGWFWVLVALLAFARGWQVTRVDRPQLVVGLPKMEHIVLGLLRPDLAVEATENTALTVPFTIVPAPGTQGSDSSEGTGLSMSPNVLAPGQEFRVRGSGLAPRSAGRLAVVEPGGSPAGRTLYTFETDARGAFDFRFDMPARFDAGSYALRAEIARPTGTWSPSETLSLAVDKTIETIFLALVGTAFGVLLSIPLSFLAARNLMAGTPQGDAIYYATRTLFNLTRSVEVLIVAVIMTVVVGIGPFAGVLALIVHSIGALGKLYSEAIESIESGPVEAISATGANRLQVIIFAVLPQVIPAFISFTLYRWDINVRMSTIIGFVGGGGIGYLLIQYINLLQWNQAGTCIWLIAIVVAVMDYASAAIRQRVA